MFAKLYWSTWLAIALIAGIVILTGNFTAMALVVFGFIAFGMVFMGMMNVLPAIVSHPAPKPPKSERQEIPARSNVVVPVHHGARSVHV